MKTSVRALVALAAATAVAFGGAAGEGLAAPAQLPGGLQSSKVTSKNEVDPRANTVVLTPSDILAVRGRPGGRQLVIVRGTTKRSPVDGGYIVAEPSQSDESGLVGRVLSIRHAKTRIYVSTTSARVDQAYKHVVVNIHQKVRPAQLSQVSGPKLSPSSDAKVPGLNFNPSRAAFTCDDPSVDAPFTLSVDLTDLTVDFQLDTNPFHPLLAAKLTIRPKLSAGLQFSGKLSCTLSAGRLIGVRIPIPTFPLVQLVVKPEFELSASGQAQVSVTWSPSVVAGFSAKPGQVTPVNAFDDGSLTPSAAASGSLKAFLGVAVAITVSGLATVTGDFGPYLKLDSSSVGGCYKLSVGLQASLDVDIDLIKHFDATIATGVFGDHVIRTNCATPSIANRSLPNGTVGFPYTTVLTTDDHRSGTWNINSGSLPPGITLSGYTLGGRPTAPGSYRFDLKFTDTHRQSADLAEAIVVLPAATSTAPSTGSTGGAKVDIVFAIDTTGSMSPYIDSALASASSVVDSLDASGADYRVGIVDYKDADYGCGDYASFIDLPFSNVRTAIIEGIASLADKVYGGCDIPEDVYSGVNAALNFPWRNGARKSVIVLGDAPGHDPEPLSGLNLAKVTAHAAAVDPAQIYSVLVGGDPDAHTFDQALADATGGETFDATTDPTAVGPAIVDAIGTILSNGPSTRLTKVAGGLYGPFSANLASSDGTGLSNRVVDFVVPLSSGPVSICSAITDANGNATCSPEQSRSTAALTAIVTDNLRFVASYAGSDTDAPAAIAATAHT